MGKFNLGSFEGVFGICLLGAVISCCVVYIVCNIVAGFPATLPEVEESILMVGFYTLITGISLFIVGGILLLINALRTRCSEIEGTPTWHVIFAVCTTIVMLIVALIIPSLI